MTIQELAKGSSAPGALLDDLRSLTTGRPDDPTPIYTKWGLTPLTGGRNNDVYIWDGPNGKTCIKAYRKTDRQRVDREWHGLIHVRSLDIAPIPLWRDSHTQRPALGMTLIPGTVVDPAGGADLAKSLALATRRMQAVLLCEPLGTWERIDSIGHYVKRLTEVWPAQLVEATDDPQTSDMLALLQSWQIRGDAKALTAPTTKVFSRGDANLLNWHTDNGRPYVVDFEFSGHSDPAVDAADHIEHISARAISDETWQSVEADLGINHLNRARFDAARRTIALRWLAVLWKQRHTRNEEFTTQLARVQSLLD